MLFKTLAISAISGILLTTLAGCGEGTDAFESNAGGTTQKNDGLTTQNRFTLLFSDPTPTFYDVSKSSFAEVTVDVSVRIGDNNNQLITQGKTIRFKTEWGFIDPSCTTDNEGICSVKWISGSSGTMPSNFRNNILAFMSGGQETFIDANDNGLLNDGETFFDVEEPYQDINDNGIYDSGIDLVLDTINGVDLSGSNNTHDPADGKYNGPNCADSIRCSTTLTTATVWDNGTLLLTGETTFNVGGKVTGLTGILILQNNLGDDLIIEADGEYSFDTALTPGSSYSVTVKTKPDTQTCTPTDNTGTVTVKDITNIFVTCTTP